MTADSIKDNSIKAEKLRWILEKDYGIHSVSELEKAIEESPGINIGIFTSPLCKNFNRSKDEPKEFFC